MPNPRSPLAADALVIAPLPDDVLRRAERTVRNLSDSTIEADLFLQMLGITPAQGVQS